MKYTANDIISLSPGRAFREKIGMYLSADRQEAINLGLRELIVNVQDEYEVFKPQNPTLTVQINTSTHELIVKDNMRGIPVGIRDDGINSLTAAFLIPHSGGKHTEGVYSSAVGINGEGNKIVCHTAKWLEVEVHRDNNIYYQKFVSTSEGASAVEDIKILGSCDDTGTTIKYVPDPLVYGDNIFVDIESLRIMLKEISMFSSGLHIVLIVDNHEEEFKSANGLMDGLALANRLSKPFSYRYETTDCKVELALQWVCKNGNIKGYANNLFMPDGGAFISGFKSSLTRTFNSLANTKYDGDTIRNVLDGYVSVKVQMGQFTNQQKTALANPEARIATSTAISNALKEFSIKRRDDFNQVIELLKRITKAEAAADRVRKQVLENVKEVENAVKSKFIDSEKLNDARTLGDNAILLLVEGKSAGGAMQRVRDIDKYGILKLRGKIINALSNPSEDVLKNEEVSLFLKATGINISDYSKSKLRYGKVAICVDSDDDGMHIACLIIALLYKLAPQYLKEGRLCWLHAPLYKRQKGNEIKVYYSDEEVAKATFKGKQTRFKGLGEMNDEDARSMFGPEQWLEILTWDESAALVIENLMGEEVQPRKDFIFNRINFEKYGEV